MAPPKKVAKRTRFIVDDNDEEDELGSDDRVENPRNEVEVVDDEGVDNGGGSVDSGDNGSSEPDYTELFDGMGYDDPNDGESDVPALSRSGSPPSVQNVSDPGVSWSCKCLFVFVKNARRSVDTDTPDPNEAPPLRRSARSATPATPRATPSKVVERVKGAEREIPCLDCIRSALSGKSDGKCFNNDVGAGKRCYRCSSGHKCLSAPPSILPLGLRMLQLLSQSKTQVRIES